MGPSDVTREEPMENFSWALGGFLWWMERKKKKRKEQKRKEKKKRKENLLQCPIGWAVF